MKKILFLFAFVLSFTTQVVQAQSPKLKVGTNPTTLNSSAALEVQSTSQGFLPPRMNLNQISAIASPAEGLSVYCTDCSPKALLSFDGNNWVNANGQEPVAPPSAPATPVATSGVGSASVTFTAPTSTGSGAIVRYTVTSFPGGLTATGTSSPIVVGNLAAGTAYTFVVRATNASGLTSTSAQSNLVTPTVGVPGVPTVLVATSTLGQSASIAFAAPSNNGGSAITGYTVTSTPGGITATGTTSPIVITGLTNATAYTFSMVATNAQGNSAVSSASNSVTPQASAPAAPTIGAATISSSTASVAFTPPVNNGGSAITSYTVTSIPGGLTATGPASPISFTGLSAAVAYTFTVTATNAAGTSQPSAASNSVIASSAPSAPSVVTATALSATSASVSFATPSANGSAIKIYTVTPSPATASPTFTGTGSPITVTGLTTGTPYTFSVTATNDIGTSTASTTTFTPQNQVPDAPTGVQATAGNAQATITFTAPTNNGGATISGYTVTSTPGNFTATGASSPLTVTGLINGTAYSFRVSSTNSIGTSFPSGASNIVIPVTTATLLPAALTSNNLNAAAAFALRRINSSYTGFAVRVRRSSDNTERDIGFTSNGDLDDAALTTFVGANNGFVTTWFDQSGNGRNITQANGALQPSIVVSGTVVKLTTGSSRTAVRYNGTVNQTLFNSNSGLPNGSNITINMVHNEIVRNENMGYSFNQNGSSGNFNDRASIHIPWNDGTMYFDWGGRLTTSRAVAINTPITFTFTYSTTLNTQTISYNGAYRATAATNIAPVTDRIILGGNNAGIQSPNATIAEFVVLPTVPEQSVLRSFEANQVAYYSLSPVAGGISINQPNVPSGVTAVAGNGSASISFSPVSGATNYTVTSTPGGFTASAASSPIQVSGLTNGTAYTFTALASNVHGTSAASSASNSVTPSAGAAGQTVPNSPTIGTATAGVNSALVTFTAPANTGNSTITGYTLTSNPGGITTKGTTSPITVNGLTAGTSYTFTVTANNSIGNSLPSAASNAVTAFNVPAQPVIGNITSVGLFASVPVTVNNNGGVITNYTASVTPGNLVFNSASASIPVYLPASGTYSVSVTVTNAAGTSVASVPVNFSVVTVQSPQLAGNIAITDINSAGFTNVNGVSPSSPISVGGTCPTSVSWQGVTYPTVNIGGQCWTARNSRAVPTATGSNIYYSFYNYSTDETSKQEGYFYTWAAAMNGTTTLRGQGVCPTGWHIPSQEEIAYMVFSIGNQVSSINNNINLPNDAMKTLYKVGEVPGATNISGFSALDMGFAESYNGTQWGYFIGWDCDCSFGFTVIWASSEVDSNNAIRATLDPLSYGNTFLAGRNKARGYAVRCLKD